MSVLRAEALLNHAILAFSASKKRFKDSLLLEINCSLRSLRADISKYRPDVYKSEKSKIFKTIHEVALGKLLT